MSSNGEIDDRLKQLAIAAKNHPPKTVERQKAVTKLFMELEKYKIINSPKNRSFSYDDYQEILVEAKQDLMLRICKEVHNYRPDKKVSQWVNFLMIKCFQEATPKVIGIKDLKPLYYGNMNLIFNKLQQQAEPDFYRIEEALIDMIQEDPDDAFKSEAMTKYPHVNFQLLLVKRVIEDASWQKISEELGVSVSNLSSFYRRSLEKFTPRFR
ncbi:hypothetical protein, partial [Microcoleus sp. OTE_8_concoct_300]|uniref:hypothetical protein n=1 Tax=Microcoleus sp. OTE_8_concoct_300 TaxID=2964710 RepID=UPI00403F8403